jgi:hypothetical protein
MHDTKDHIDHPCPNCGEEGLYWLKRDVHCEACDCSWGIHEILEEHRMMQDALKEIKLGRGPRSRDPLEHADNCIAAMANVATLALEGAFKAGEV